MADEENGFADYIATKTIPLRSGFLFKRQIDPSADLEAEISQFCTEEQTRFDTIVATIFDLPENEFKKFAFIWTPQRARLIDNDYDIIERKRVVFRSEADLTILYIKKKSLVIFATHYDFAITTGRGGNNGTIYRSGAKSFAIEEIAFDKITSLGAHHNEEIINVVPDSQSTSLGDKFITIKDGFVIRAGDSFRIPASEIYSDELKDAWQIISTKI